MYDSIYIWSFCAGGLFSKGKTHVGDNIYIYIIGNGNYYTSVRDDSHMHACYSLVYHIHFRTTFFYRKIYQMRLPCALVWLFTHALLFNLSKKGVGKRVVYECMWIVYTHRPSGFRMLYAYTIRDGNVYIPMHIWMLCLFVCSLRGICGKCTHHII